MGATLLEGWVMPPPPCEGARPCIYGDNDVLWPHWVDASGEYVEGSDVAWPFREESVHMQDFLALGFHDVDDLPEVAP